MQENELLAKVVTEFLNATDHDCEKAEEAIKSFQHFYEFLEENDGIKEALYDFLFKMLDDYITFKFYHSPIPALADDKEYMKKFKEDVYATARTFFNFGGFPGI